MIKSKKTLKKSKQKINRILSIKNKIIKFVIEKKRRKRTRSYTRKELFVDFGFEFANQNLNIFSKSCSLSSKKKHVTSNKNLNTTNTIKENTKKSKWKVLQRSAH